MGGGGGFVGEWALMRLLPRLFGRHGNRARGCGTARKAISHLAALLEGLRALVIAAQAFIRQGGCER